LKFGVCVPNYGETLSLEGVRSIALEAERLGYESVWTTDHLLMPENSGTQYERILDSIATLAFLAPLTQRVKLGVSSLIIAMRNPIAAAKQLASIDFLSGGRILVAMAAGWNEREFSFVGADFHRRGRMLDESIALFRALWRGDSSFQGRMIKFEAAVFEPKSANAKIPIWIGGASPSAMRRAAELGDAWHPNVLPLETFGNLVREFRDVSPQAKEKEICVRIGLNTSALKSEYVGPTGEKRILFSGDMGQNRQIVSELEWLGVSEAVLVPSPDGRVATANQIESIQRFAKEFLR